MRTLAKWMQLNYPFRNQIYRARQARALRKWDGKGPAPHPVKQGNIKKYALKHGIRTLVETGTYYGDMIEALRECFDQIYSIEVSDPLFRKAKRRFRGYPNIEIMLGDSAVLLGELVPTLREPALFWLDGHYSGGVTGKGDRDTPVFEELGHIFASPQRHIVLIDDARCFGEDPDYPSAKELVEFIQSQRDADVRVEEDSFIVE